MLAIGRESLDYWLTLQTSYNEAGSGFKKS
jgi:hypothetical protein